MAIIETIESLYKQHGVKYKLKRNSIKSGNLEIKSNGEIYIGRKNAVKGREG